MNQQWQNVTNIWRGFGRPAWLYLVHAALLTASLTALELFLNLAVLAFGYSRADLGVLNLVTVWVSVVLSLPLWWFATWLGLRTALVVHGVLQALAVALFAWAGSWPWLLAAAALSGGASVLFQVSAQPLIMRYATAQNRDALFSANAAVAIGVAGLASLVAGVLPGWLAGLLGGSAESPLAYRATFALAAAGVLFSVLPLLWLPRVPRPAPASNGTAQNWRSVLAPLWRRAPALLALLVSPMLISFGAALLLPYLNLFFKQRFGVSDAVLGLIFALLNIGTGAAVLLGPLLSARFGKLRAVALAQLLSLPFLLAMGFVPLLWLVVGAALVRGGLFNLSRPLYDAYAMERSEEWLRPTVVGLIGGASTVGYMVAPAISVYVQERYGFAPLFVTTALCYSASALAVLVLWKQATTTEGGTIPREF